MTTQQIRNLWIGDTVTFANADGTVMAGKVIMCWPSVEIGWPNGTATKFTDEDLAMMTLKSTTAYLPSPEI